MTFARSLSIIAAISVSSLVASAWAATEDQHDSHHPAATAAAQVAQAASNGNSMMGRGRMSTMPGYSEQMKAMQVMHDKMMATTTPEERNALMAEQMKLMQNGMGMMNQMVQGAMSGTPSDMAAREGMTEQRMDMMQSMMQMLMDRMPPAPAAK